MRVLQFMRFQKTADGTYFGIMEPLYNVFSLTVRHFRDRFADQPWIIYDARRRFGYYYDRTDVSEITFSSILPSNPLPTASSAKTSSMKKKTLPGSLEELF